MPRFHTLKIKHITRETPDCVALTLDVPAELRATFQYRPGQYLTFRREVGGEEIRRSYSLCSSPLDEEWRVAVKKVPGGRFSQLAVEELRAGDAVEVLPPAGSFGPATLLATQTRHYVAFAAGSGITPILSIIKTVLLTEPQSRVTLVYGNRGRNSIIFKEAIEALKNTFLQRLRVYHVLSREQGDTDLFFGRLDQAKVQQFMNTLIPPSLIDECFICGPEQMIQDVRAALSEAGVAPEKVHFELFGTSTPRPTTAAPTPPPGHDDQQSRVTVQLDGHTHVLPMSYYGNTILDELLATGVDAPYSCKNGMCSTCRARITTGQVEMDVNYSLSDTEVAKGYVLTCQARPVSAEVEVDFDQ
ncbi:1,2-phenylacetyl-CoA epoxidase subunit PaaE [Hymenobacter defluvii]|uniref:Phenylacetate-CoA oxygenase/reductase subunit PaaK n=1 Tax=Hymenobacter defluvii TaxID=2054411 RepID=A0ABS3TB74_9BACT|nr:1,2-phenylacetyl-CoA epoxidase subunit PaaE [Hymenobacter defluvii]MBO3270910.1 phenylacetate-CoA oxygenase/reductase subunit PaaK [Hymenobacter defluvii]